MAKTDTITIGPLTFVVVPEALPEPKVAPQPKPQRTRRPSVPQCTASRGVRCSDGLYRMNYLAARFERKKNRGWLERWGIWKTFDE